ncbi:MAG: PD-(D/E)XK nuclease family protein [Candidatus Poseidoniaceae archaeon]|nr:PD-(D/E)XK nuclease family protein [Candidatus Poseidoniaceae archaeon]
MPAQIPPEAQSIGRARGRLSASSLTTFLRCNKQWYLNYKIGLRGPLSPHQVMGIEVEDAYCSILMHRAPSVDSFDDLKKWLYSLVSENAQKALTKGKSVFEDAMWNDGDFDEHFDLELVSKMLENGITLQLEEVKACYEAGGGIHEFTIPAPCWDSPPHFTQPDKANSMIAWKDEPHEFSENITWQDAWEIARPWVKDPRNPEPQRMYHPNRWAAGECDLVLRWDGNTRIVDIKMGDGEGKFATSLDAQLNFYAWLWNETHADSCTGLEGWYLTNGLRKIVEVNPKSTEQYRDVHDQMKAWECDNSLPLKTPCDGEAGGCHWCSLSEVPYQAPEITMPCEPLSSIPSRVNVKGRLQGAWGPLPNHYGEMVLGAMIQAGDKMVTLEESQPGSYPAMHDSPQDDVVITGALPGVWRRQARLYLDELSSISSQSDAKLTRMGMLRTKANVEGVVLSCSKRDGKRADGRPWSMMSFHLWDGERVAEVVAFGSSINGTMLSIRPGMIVKMTSAELGWREGLVQLRIDSRNTRVEIKSKP